METKYPNKKTTIGGGDIASAMGLNPYETPLQLWKRKMGIIQREDNKFMKMGRKLENIIIELFKEDMQEKYPDFNMYDTEQKVIQYEKNKNFVAAIDKLCFFNGEKYVFEAKTSQKKVKSIEDIPIHYYMQVNWYMGITGINKAIISYLVNGLDRVDIYLEKDEETIKAMFEFAEEFIQKHLINEIEPEPMTYQEILERITIDKNKVKVATEDILKLVDEYAYISKQIKELEENKEKIKEEIQKYMYDSGVLISERGEKLATLTKVEGKLTIDAEKLKKEKPDIFNEYAKKSNPYTIFKVTKGIV